MHVFSGVYQGTVPALAPSACWECERVTADVVEARFPSGTRQRTTVVLCHTCFQLYYVSLSMELLQHPEAVQPLP